MNPAKISIRTVFLPGVDYQFALLHYKLEVHFAHTCTSYFFLVLSASLPSCITNLKFILPIPVLHTSFWCWVPVCPPALQTWSSFCPYLYFILLPSVHYQFALLHDEIKVIFVHTCTSYFFLVFSASLPPCITNLKFILSIPVLHTSS